MKRALLATAVFALSASAALAADLPSRKAPILPPPPPPPPMWTGFYVGLNAGGTWAASNNALVGAVPLTDFNANGLIREAIGAAGSVPLWPSNNNGGFIGGGQIGYNYQLMNSFVVGLEADIQGIAGGSGAFSVVGSAPEPGTDDWYTTAVSARGSLDYLGTVRGRLGWLVMPTLLVYGTGGFAYGGVSYNAAMASYEFEGGSARLNSVGVGGANFSNTQTGWTAGGGLEWMFWPNWSAKVEYLYYDLGTVRLNTTVIGIDQLGGAGDADWAYAVTASKRVNGNIVRAGVNYHFNWGAAPVVAKY